MLQICHPKLKHSEAFYLGGIQRKKKKKKSPTLFLSALCILGECLCLVSMELSLHSTVPHAIHLELEPKTSAVNNHLQCKVEIVKFHSAGRSEPCEETSRHGIEVCC